MYAGALSFGARPRNSPSPLLLSSPQRGFCFSHRRARRRFTEWPADALYEVASRQLASVDLGGPTVKDAVCKVRRGPLFDVAAPALARETSRLARRPPILRRRCL